jgi:hypothetical protein
LSSLSSFEHPRIFQALQPESKNLRGVPVLAQALSKRVCRAILQMLGQGDLRRGWLSVSAENKRYLTSMLGHIGRPDSEIGQ